LKKWQSLTCPDQQIEVLVSGCLCYVVDQWHSDFTFPLHSKSAFLDLSIGCGYALKLKCHLCHGSALKEANMMCAILQHVTFLPNRNDSKSS
jgi:hypothetical protein